MPAVPAVPAVEDGGVWDNCEGRGRRGGDASLTSASADGVGGVLDTGGVFDTVGPAARYRRRGGERPRCCGRRGGDASLTSPSEREVVIAQYHRCD